MFESCVEIRSYFSDFLDDLCTPERRKSIRYHLSFCDACREQLDQWQGVREELQALPRQQVSPELALRLRVKMSHQLHHRVLDDLRLRFENAFKPFLIPATGGILTAVICFGLMMGSQVAPVTPQRAAAQVSTPARVQELAPMDFSGGDLVLVTQINAEGHAKAYRVLSGQDSPEVTQRLDRMLFFSSFRPATMYGKPTDGEVVLSLRRITVRG